VVGEREREKSMRKRIDIEWEKKREVQGECERKIKGRK
jgi:hypothetical protein